MTTGLSSTGHAELLNLETKLKCKCCETTREVAEIMAGIATGKYTIEDLKNAMRKKPQPPVLPPSGETK